MTTARQYNNFQQLFNGLGSTVEGTPTANVYGGSANMAKYCAKSFPCKMISCKPHNNPLGGYITVLSGYSGSEKLYNMLGSKSANIWIWVWVQSYALHHYMMVGVSNFVGMVFHDLSEPEPCPHSPHSRSGRVLSWHHDLFSPWPLILLFHTWSSSKLLFDPQGSTFLYLQRHH